jgi:hypothetical protein
LAWEREKGIITCMLAGVAGSRIASNASQNSETSWSVTGLDGPWWSCLSHRSSARNSARSRTFVQDLPNLAASFKNLIRLSSRDPWSVSFPWGKSQIARAMYSR